MPDVFVLVESNSTGTGRLFARTLRELGIEPVLLVADPGKYSYLATDGVAFHVVDTSSLEAMSDAVKQWLLTHRLRGIYSSSEYFIGAASQLAARFNLPGANPEAVLACRNKYQTRGLLCAARLPTPQFLLFRSLEDIDRALQNIALPAVVKPTQGTGSFGVRLCTSREDAISHGSLILQQRVNERGLAVQAEGLVEEFIEGIEYSVETFGSTVVGTTRKHVCQPPSFVEIGHDFPASLSPAENAAIRGTVLSALKALNLVWGPAHTELKVTSKGIYIIEVNPRLAGGHIPTLIKQATGADLIRSTLELAAGQSASVRVQPHAYASIRFMLSPGRGTLSETSGVEVARKTPGVVEVQTYFGSAQQIEVHGDFRDRLGHVIAGGNSLQAAADSADSALRAVSLHVH